MRRHARRRARAHPPPHRWRPACRVPVCSNPSSGIPYTNFVMAALEAATHPARVGAPRKIHMRSRALARWVAGASPAMTIFLIAPSGQLPGGRRRHQRLERFGLADREIGQDLAVDLDAGLGEPADKSAVGQPVLAHGGVDALDPQRAEVALAQLAPDIGVLHRAVDRGVGGGDVVLAPATETLGLFENALAALVRRDGAGGF